MAHARAVEKFHDAGLDRRRLGIGNHGRCDDHVAAVVEGELGARRIAGVDQIIAEAVGMKFLAAPLTPEQVNELIQTLQ
jgi:hypothetical protein